MTIYQKEKIEKIEKIVIQLKEEREEVLNKTKKHIEKDFKNIFCKYSLESYNREYISLNAKINDLKLLISILEDEDDIKDFKEVINKYISREKEKIKKLQIYKRQLEEILKK